MSSPKISRCLFCAFRPFPTLANVPTRRGIHATGSHQARRRKNFESVTAEAMGLRKGFKSATTEEPSTTEDTGLEPSSEEQGSMTSRPHGRPQRAEETLDPVEAERRKEQREEAESLNRSYMAYTPREQQLLALKYTPEQVRALMAGEKSISIHHVHEAVIRKDPWALKYLDDFSKIQPLADKPVRAPDSDVDPNIRPLTQDEIDERFARHMMQYDQEVAEYEARSAQKPADYRAELRQKLEDTTIHPADGLTTAQRADRLRKRLEFTEGPDSQLMFESFVSNPENFFYSPKGTLNSQSDVLSQKVPKFTDSRLKTEDSDTDFRIEQLMKQTGMTKGEISAIRVKTLIMHRVVNQTRMGKIDSMYFLTIAGNENGMLGIGEGKSAEPEDGKRQSVMAAIRNMKPIPRYENRTIFGEVEAKVSASVVRLYARPPGFGNRCQSLIFEMARAAGLSDLSARCVRSRNKMNVVKATYQALLGQRLPEDVARARGRKMVDVRKVYYEGSVH
ncbi:hypothetical protein MBLNU457_1169t3 [Dothideomycetes sp. NU457]